jgi:hypothetical protein
MIYLEKITDIQRFRQYILSLESERTAIVFLSTCRLSHSETFRTDVISRAFIYSSQLAAHYHRTLVEFFEINIDDLNINIDELHCEMISAPEVLIVRGGIDLIWAKERISGEIQNSYKRLSRRIWELYTATG